MLENNFWDLHDATSINSTSILLQHAEHETLTLLKQNISPFMFMISCHFLLAHLARSVK